MRLTALWPRTRDAAIDLALTALVVAASLAPLDMAAPGGGSTGGAAPTLALAGVVLLARRRFPVAVLGLVTLLGLAALLTGHRTPVVEVPVAVGMYTVGRLGTRRATVTAAVLLALCLPAGVLLSAASLVGSLLDVLAPAVLQPAVLVAFAAALGSAVKANRAAIDAANDRALRAEQSREAEAQRRVAEDRLVIARDLHDSIAHRIAVINLHAGVAGAAIRSRPDEAERSIAVIGDAARSVIGEIQDMLLLLRSGPAERAASDEPTLDRLDSLVSVFARSGLRVHLTVEGDVRALPGTVSAVAYRVVQESLTNAYKHGDRRAATLTVAASDRAVSIRVSNPFTGTASPGGHGLVGMRERVAGVDGALTAAPQDGEWVVESVLPLEGDRTADAASAVTSSGRS